MFDKCPKAAQENNIIHSIKHAVRIEQLYTNKKTKCTSVIFYFLYKSSTEIEVNGECEM